MAKATGGGRVRNAIQSFLYWLGPLYCVLLGALLLFGSFIIQLLTSIGVPYIKAFDFYRFDLSDYTFIELGMWAACLGRKGFGIPTLPGYQEAEEFNCPPARWGWDGTMYSAITKEFFHHNLPKALIFHPISCCFTFFALVTALVTLKRKRHHWTLPFFSFFSCFFALVSFVIDLATFVPARSKLQGPDAFNILGKLVISTEYGPAFWLSLATFCLDMIGNFIILAGYTIWRYQRISREQRRRSSGYEQDIEVKAGSRMTRRGYFANDSDDDDEGSNPTGAFTSAKEKMSSFRMADLARGKKARANDAQTPDETKTKATATAAPKQQGKRRPTPRKAIAKHASAAAGAGATTGVAVTGGKASPRGAGRRGVRNDEAADSEEEMDARAREAEEFEVGSDEEEEVVASNRGHAHDDDDNDDDDDDDENGQQGDATTDDDDGFSDAMSAYADARSDAGGRSRSNLAVNELSRASSPPSAPSSPNPAGRSYSVRRKPVQQYDE